MRRDARSGSFMERMFHHRDNRFLGMDEDERYRVFVSPIGLVPWDWMGIRGEAYFAALINFLVLCLFLGMWYAGLAISGAILFIGKLLSFWHPRWPELLMRLLFQPIGYLDN